MEMEHAYYTALTEKRMNYDWNFLTVLRYKYTYLYIIEVLSLSLFKSI